MSTYKFKTQQNINTKTAICTTLSYKCLSVHTVYKIDNATLKMTTLLLITYATDDCWSIILYNHNEGVEWWCNGAHTIIMVTGMNAMSTPMLRHHTTFHILTTPLDNIGYFLPKFHSHIGLFHILQ